MTSADAARLTVVLTEAELDVLEKAHLRHAGLTLAGLAGRPGVVGDTDVDDPDTAAPEVLREAARSLRLRGLLRPDGVVRDDGELGGQLTLMLDVRFTASRVLLVHRVVAGPSDQDPVGARDDHLIVGDRLVHLAGVCACLEDVFPDGSRHLYLEPDLDLVPAWVADVTVPQDAAAGGGPPRTVRPDRMEEELEVLGLPTVAARLEVLVRPTDGGEPLVASSHLLALGPRGCWVADLARPEASSAVELRPVSPDWVQRWTRRQVAHVAEEGTMSG